MLGDAIKNSVDGESKINEIAQLYLKNLMEKCEKVNPDLGKPPIDKYHILGLSEEI